MVRARRHGAGKGRQRMNRGKAVLMSLLAVGVVLFALLLRKPRAETVSHHGDMVEANGSATDCILCHDGTISTAVPSCTVRCSFGGSHSILKPYPPPGKEMFYVPIEQVTAAGIVLDNGRVTCISCHNLRNGNRYHLSVDNAGSRLCFVCHLN
jgi:hypothetical protein